MSRKGLIVCRFQDADCSSGSFEDINRKPLFSFNDLTKKACEELSIKHQVIIIDSDGAFFILCISRMSKSGLLGILSES
jgi:hypothetical protein